MIINLRIYLYDIIMFSIGESEFYWQFFKEDYVVFMHQNFISNNSQIDIIIRVKVIFLYIFEEYFYQYGQFFNHKIFFRCHKLIRN